MPARVALIVSLVIAIVAACGSPAASNPQPSKAAAVDARSASAMPTDFAPLALTTCPSPETGFYTDFAAAYRSDIKFHQNVATVAGLIAQLKADNWVSSLAAPDAKPEVCRGNLGFGYAPRQVGKEPAIESDVFVFNDVATARTAYSQIQAQLVPHPNKSGASIVGVDSAWTDAGAVQRLVWQRGRVVMSLLTQDVDNWQSGVKAIDARVTR